MFGLTHPSRDAKRRARDSVCCDTCRYSVEEKTTTTTDGDEKTGGEILAEQIEELAQGVEGIEVRRQSCLMGCERHCNTAVAAPGKLSYVIGKFEPNTDSAEAVVEYAKLHAASEKGQVPFKTWPQGVKGHFVARIPSLG